MTYELIERKTVQEEVTFSHCMIKKGNENIMWGIVNSIPANFHTIDFSGPKGFAHITKSENIKEIKEKGLIYTRDSFNHLGDGNYCVIGENAVIEEDIVNFLKFINPIKNKEEFSIIFGYYCGDMRYCIQGDDSHRGYTVLLEDVPGEQITKSFQLKELFGKNLYSLIIDEIKNNYNIIDEIIYQEFLKSVESGEI